MHINQILEKYSFDPDENNLIWFDCESFSEAESYESTFRDLIAISKGKFDPQDMHWRSGYAPKYKGHEIYLADVRFRINESEHFIKIICQEWFDIRFIEALNKVLDKHSKTDERFYALETGDQSMVIVFVDQMTADRLRADEAIDTEYPLWADPYYDLEIHDLRYQS